MPRPRLKLLGKKFGRLTVISDAGNKLYGRVRLSRWRVRCDCGREKVVTGRDLVKGSVRSCGCLRESRPTAQARKQTPRQQVLLRKTRRAWARRLREEAITHYGGKCVCCGEKTFEFLAVVRIVGGRAQRKINTGSMPWWLKKNGYPKGFRVLCHNCNMAKGMYGCCPHEEKIVVG